MSVKEISDVISEVGPTTFRRAGYSNQPYGRRRDTQYDVFPQYVGGKVAVGVVVKSLGLPDDIMLDESITSPTAPDSIALNQGTVCLLHSTGSSEMQAQTATGLVRIASPHKLIPWYDKLDQTRRLKDGWNTYHASAPSVVAIQNARRFLRTLGGHGLEPTRLAASAAGGIGITFKSQGRKAYFEFYNDALACVMFSDDRADPTIKTLLTTEASYNAAIKEARTYLNGIPTPSEKRSAGGSTL